MGCPSPRVHDGGQLIDDDRTELDDARLVARIAAGEEAAFVIAYDRHSAFVFGSVARFRGDREAAAEVVQDAFVTLWRRARQFDARSGSLLTWLLAIAPPRAIDRPPAAGPRPGRAGRWPASVAGRHPARGGELRRRLVRHGGASRDPA